MKKIDNVKNIIAEYEKNSDVKAWTETCRIIEEIYRSQSSSSVLMSNRILSAQDLQKFNILWSNMQTILPAVYSRNPKPDVSRRFNASDAVARETSVVLERCLNYFIDSDEFKHTMRQCAFDWLLLGRGTVWVRYEPTIKTEQVQIETDLAEDTAYEEKEELYFEDVCADFVHVDDFGHNIGKIWSEVFMVWRRIRLSKEAVEERFGKEKTANISYGDYEKEQDERQNADEDTNKPLTAIIYEVWDSRSKKVYFLQKDGQDFLDVQDDPLELRGFFPCPRPLLANTTNKTLIPVPEYQQYKTQAEQLNVLATRINSIQKIVSVRGCYDSSAAGMDKMMSSANENQLVPVNMADLMGERGGLQNAIQFFPLQDVSKALEYLYIAFDNIKNQLYEITGISDILRGESDAQETATGVRTKGQYALLRITDRQQEVQRFVRDVIRLFGEIIAEKFSEKTIRQIGGEGLLTNEEKAYISQGGMLPDLQYNRPDEINTMLKKPSFDDIIALLRDDPARCMRIDIETDSTIKQDQIQDRADRVEFIKAIGSYINEVLPAAQQDPSLVPVLAQMFMFGVRGYQVGKETEQVLSDWVQQAIQASQNPQPKQDPKMAELEQKMQLETQKMQAKAQIDQQTMQNNMQAEAAKAQQTAMLEEKQAQMDMMVAQHNQEMQSRDAKYQADLDHSHKMQQMQYQQQLEQQKLDFEKWRVEYENNVKMQIAEMAAQNKKEDKDASNA
jgi:hypothetical protein